MALGYDGKLYILAFDHRGSFQKKWFGIETDPTAEQTQQISDGKHLVFEGLEAALERGADPSVSGALVDEQFGEPSGIPQAARERGLKLSMPVEKSGQNEFDFEYGDDFGAHIEKFDPDFSKVLVRYNPDGDAEMNERQAGRLKRLADWLHEHDRKFLFELLVPAEPHQLEQVGGDSDRYDAELRPELMRHTIAGPARGARASCASCSAAGPTTTRSTTGCARGRRSRPTSASPSGVRSGATRCAPSSTAACPVRTRPPRSPTSTFAS